MRHSVRGRKLGRTSSHRIALFRNQLASLVEQERIITTLPKAKELRPIAERVFKGDEAAEGGEETKADKPAKQAGGKSRGGFKFGPQGGGKTGGGAPGKKQTRTPRKAGGE